jgi:1-acyl-sn-glycerol-3-phosphate acyltransferase
MTDFEAEFKRLRRSIKFLSDAALLFKKIEVRGAANFIAEGPNIILGNHIGSYKDVGLLLRIVPRRIFFTANSLIFSREDFSDLVLRHMKRHLKQFGVFIHLILNPYYAYVVNFISRNIASIGTIPVDIYGSKRAAVLKCQDYLKKGRAVIALQGRGRVDPRDRNPYVKEFRGGVSIMAYNLEREGLPVPVTPLSIFGTHYPWAVPARIRVNVGEPLFIRDFMRRDEQETVDVFRAALQARVAELLVESLGW